MHIGLALQSLRPHQLSRSSWNSLVPPTASSCHSITPRYIHIHPGLIILVLTYSLWLLAPQIWECLWPEFPLQLVALTIAVSAVADTTDLQTLPLVIALQSLKPPSHTPRKRESNQMMRQKRLHQSGERHGLDKLTDKHAVYMQLAFL